MFNLNEIATWFDRLTMSGCALRNDGASSFDRLRMSGGFTLTPTLSHQGRGGLRQAQDERGWGTGLYIDEQDGQDIERVGAPGLPRPSTGWDERALLAMTSFAIF